MSRFTSAAVVALLIFCSSFVHTQAFNNYNKNNNKNFKNNNINKQNAPTTRTAADDDDDALFNMNRKKFFQNILSSVAFVTAGSSTAAILSSTTTVEPANAIISSKYCAYGTGDGCEELAEGNEFIKQLQAKSAANKEQIQADARNAYYMKNYPDWFASVGKSMVKKPDGTFMILDDAELQVLKEQGKIGVEYAMTMGGRTRDLTQKPIMILKE